MYYGIIGFNIEGRENNYVRLWILGFLYFKSWIVNMFVGREEYWFVNVVMRKEDKL